MASKSTFIAMIMTLCLMQASLLIREAIHEEGSMRSNDNGDTMSNMVGTVLSGFEYKAQKEKYDNLTKFFKTMKKISIYRFY